MNCAIRISEFGNRRKKNMTEFTKIKYDSGLNNCSRISSGFMFIVLQLIIIICFQLAGSDLFSQNYKYPYLNYDSSTKTYKFQIPDILRPKQDDGMIFDSSLRGSKSRNRVLENSDTAKNRIVNLWYANDELNVKILLDNEKSHIEIFVINLLGKKVLPVYSGPAKPKEEIYTEVASTLPQGVYLCMLQGKNFRHGRKFIVSR